LDRAALRELARVIQRRMQEPASPVARVVQTVAAHYRVPVPVLRGRCRQAQVAWPRLVAMACVREGLPHLPDREVARHFHRHKSLVRYACAAVQARAETDPRAAADLARLRAKLADRAAGNG
jgi:chromosomal replication initiation ATPase DnaA